MLNFEAGIETIFDSLVLARCELYLWKSASQILLMR